MAENFNPAPENDEIIFAEETPPITQKAAWTVMIVDDEPDVHKITRMVLEDFVLEGKNIKFISAYSAAQARQLMLEHPDTALILLDVVMESNHAGLDLIQYIRETLNNKFVRIVIRTGQPGYAPEREVILKYDINDYKLKTSLTDHTLFTTVVSALRTYRDIKVIEKSRNGLVQIIDATSSLFDIQSIKNFAAGVLTQLISILGLNDDSLYIHTSGFAAENSSGKWHIIAGTGLFADYVNHSVFNAVPSRIKPIIEEALSTKKNIFRDEQMACFFTTRKGSENLLYLCGYKIPLSELDEKMVHLFFTNVSIALDNIELNQDIVNTQKDVIYILGEVVENRSQETANHVRRIAKYAYNLALYYGLDDKDMELIRLASPMHDVGKIGIPEAILHKPGKLTTAEFNIVKTHARIGYNILNHSNREIMKAAAMIALEHHERWNGRGYPQSLQGEQIHIFSRIVALADVFDALSCKRIYKEAWDMDRIVEHIKSEREQHFDPELTDILLNNLDQFIAIQRSLPDKGAMLERPE